MKIGINGFGRIGRALFRLMWQRKDLECISINEPYASIEDIAYFLKYDSLYGRFEVNVQIININTLKIFDDNRVLHVCISHFSEILDYDCSLDQEAYIIESSGNANNIEYYKTHTYRKALFTFSSEEISAEFIVGVNDENLSKNKSNFISSSICDVVALAPVLKIIYKKIDVFQTIITTLHPALSYQKVIDNYPPKGIYRSLGRQYADSIIPKRTSAENVLKKLYPNKGIRCMSYRIPTESVCAADITIISHKPININCIIDTLRNTEGINFCYDDLVSIDLKATPFSATVDMRWTEIVNDFIFKSTIWYDNEYGYSSRVIELLDRWKKQDEEKYINENCNFK